jgi:capsular exopolysaccharide synthesis family protein
MMGRVFDALQRAEEERARRSGEAAAGGQASAAETLTPIAPRGGSRRVRAGSLWRRLLSFRRRQVVEDASAVNKRRIALLQPRSLVAEQFRTLRARIDSIAATHPLRSIAVTSANGGDGKTMAAVNLALVMSMSVGRKVVLVDCDLRRPRVHESLGLRVDAGLAEVLRGTAELDDALVPLEGTALQVLPVRSLPANPSELLASGRMRELVEKLGARFDWLVLDVPPTLGLPDAKTVADVCDAILFVVRAHSTPREDAEAALDILDRSRVLGVVLNEADMDPARYEYAG